MDFIKNIFSFLGEKALFLFCFCIVSEIIDNIRLHIVKTTIAILLYGQNHFH